MAATERVAFPVGHASAQLGWRGLASRPTWRILLYSAENPPTRRGLVSIDEVDAEIVAAIHRGQPRGLVRPRRLARPGLSPAARGWPATPSGNP
ncbi:MAG: hypothetical protein R2711_10025 [Acidimicrobiales bacterium]